LPEAGPAEIATVNASFNRMVADLTQMERDRAVLLAGISHDLRTPLTRMRLEVELSVRHVSSQRDQRLGGYVVGGSFPSFDVTARQIITALLGASAICTVGEPAPRAAHSRPERPVRSGVWRERPVRRPEQPRPEQSSWISPAP
jgi:signal transduction histidine kinase